MNLKQVQIHDEIFNVTTLYGTTLADLAARRKDLENLQKEALARLDKDLRVILEADRDNSGKRIERGGEDDRRQKEY